MAGPVLLVLLVVVVVLLFLINIYQMFDCRGVEIAHVFQVVIFENEETREKTLFCIPFACFITSGGMREYTAFPNTLYSIAPASHGTMRALVVLLYSSCSSRVRSFQGLGGLNDKDTE